MTVLERSLLESLNLVTQEYEKIEKELEEATNEKTFWYDAYCRQQKELDNLKEESDANHK